MGGKRGRLIIAIALAAGVLGVQAGRPSPVRAEWAAQVKVTFFADADHGDGAGRVTSDDGLIDCSYDAGVTTGDCIQDYTHIADFVTQFTVVMTVAPAKGSFGCKETFTDCGLEDQALTEVYTFIRGGDDDRNLRTSFTRYYIGFNGDVVGPGRIDRPGGVQCQPAAGWDFCRAYKYGSSVTWTAVPDAGSNFSYWEGGTCGDTPRVASCSFPATKSFDSRAVFGKWKLTYRSDGPGKTCVIAGSTTCAGGDTSRSRWIDAGDSFVITADPAKGYEFDHWNKGKCAGQGTTCVLSLDADSKVTAFYVKIVAPTPTPRPTPTPTPRPTPRTTTAPVTPVPVTAEPAPTTAAKPSVPEATDTPAEPAGGPSGSPGETDGAAIATPVPAPSPPPLDPAVAEDAGSMTLLLVLAALLAATIALGLGFGLGRRGRRGSGRAGKEA